MGFQGLESVIQAMIYLLTTEEKNYLVEESQLIKEMIYLDHLLLIKIQTMHMNLILIWINKDFRDFHNKIDLQIRIPYRQIT